MGQDLVTTTTTLTTRGTMSQIAALVLNSLDSEHSRRAYGRAVADFLAWYDAQGRPGLDKATVNAWKRELMGQGLAASTINLRLCAVRKLATEAGDVPGIDPDLAAGAASVAKVKGVKQSGTRSGHWLTRAQAEQLLAAPGSDTLRGLRDTAILALMLGGGLRRSEVARLTFDHIQQREGRWVVVDLVGKGNRVRSVPIPAWAKAAVDRWATGSGVTDGRIFRPVERWTDQVSAHSTGISSQAVHNVVKRYARRLAASDPAFARLAPHDLRRTYAHLARAGGARLEQIQLSLGHTSVRTTELYLGVAQDLTEAPCDVLGLRIAA